MEIKVFTLPTCPTCPFAKRIAAQVAQKYSVGYREIDLSTREGQREGSRYQIMSTPSIAIDDDVVSRGKLLTVEALENEVSKRLPRKQASGI